MNLFLKPKESQHVYSELIIWLSIILVSILPLSIDFITLAPREFFCFSGNPKFIQVDVDLLSDHHINFYDIDWNLLPIRCQYPNSKEKIPKPLYYSEMLKIASDLSEPFSHVRVDFYQYDNQLKIGELTFFDGSGFYSFHPDKYDFIFGKEFPLIEYKSVD